MITIVHYISTLKGGGAQTQLIHLCNNLNKNKFQCIIVCWDKESSIPILSHVKIVEVGRGNKWSVLLFMNRIYTLSKKLNADISHMWLPEIITLPAALESIFNGRRIISTERRLPVSNFSKLWIRDRIDYITHIFAQKVVTNFPFPIKRKSLLNRFLSSKGVTIYNGIEVNSDSFEKMELDKSIFQIIYCGRLVKHKNVDVLIKSVSILLDKGYNVNLKILGEGEELESLQLLCKMLKIDDRVFFLGYQDDWRNFTTDAKCFVLPTEREGMPNVLFEAISFNLAIISTNIEEINCHFTDMYDALLVEPRDVKQLVIALEKMLLSDLLQDHLRVNAGETLSRYSIGGMVNKYSDLYDEILS